MASPPAEHLSETPSPAPGTMRDGARLPRRGAATGRRAAHLAISARRVRADRRGSIVLLAAFSFSLLMAASVMALGMAQMYVSRSNIQTIADQSAMSAAYAYSKSGSQTTALSAAQSLANVNGIANPTSSVTAAYLSSSPSGDGNTAEKVTVTQTLPLIPFVNAIFHLPSVTMSASSWSEIENRSACFESVNGGNITTNGTITVTATGCNVQSSGTITWAVNGGSGTVTASKITAHGAISEQGDIVINGPQVQNTLAPPDYYAANATTLFSGMSSAQNLTVPSAPNIGTQLYGYATSNCTAANTSSNPLAEATGNHGYISSPPASCYISFTGGSGTTTSVSGSNCLSAIDTVAICLTGNHTYHIAFGPGTYNIAGISVSNGTLVMTATGNPTINIWNGIKQVQNGAITFDGSATWNVLGGIYNSSYTGTNYSGPGNTLAFCTTTCSSSTVAMNVDGGIEVVQGTVIFANGNVTVSSGDGAGTGPLSNNTIPNGAGIDINGWNGGNLVVLGDGNFNIANGIYVGGSSNLYIGRTSGQCATFNIPSTIQNGLSADAISNWGSSTLKFNYPCTNVRSKGNIQVGGNWYMNSNAYAATSNWNVYGNLNVGYPQTSGGVVVDSCKYGGTDWTGNLVQVVVSGNICIGAGYTNINLTSQASVTTSTLGNVNTVLLASNGSSGSSTIGDGANITATGVVYIPNQPLNFLGSGTITGGGSDNCVIVDVGSLSLQAQGTLISDCTNVIGNQATASLVQ